MAAVESPQGLRRVRSFVRRPGRLTPAQRRALDELLPRYGVEESRADVRAAFPGPAPLVVEVGFGNGEALVAMAASEPQRNFLGIEVHEPGVGRALRAIEDAGLDNVRVAMRDAVEVFDRQVRPGSLEQVRMYFPDPWPKKRHHKRRIVQAGFVERLGNAIGPGGLLHLATDWAPYAEWMREVIGELDTVFVNQGQPYVERPSWRPRTRFERRGLGRGHAIFDLLFLRR
ncbi:MAG: tRNA (guanosine(46)-N7)-methyltransferase TrmB [Wenzhouxiangella sp.]|nr:MAG: tRNA (guanosine(46)-N7)-methyltransferase TrmB [Wenzhouxiangella sp.]